MNRRDFIKRGALWVPTIFVPRLIRAQSLPMSDLLIDQTAKNANTAAGGGSNNVALVGTNKGGAQVANSATNVAFTMATNPTTGNDVLVGVAIFSGSTTAMANGDLVTSGTASVTKTFDTSLNATSTTVGLAIWRLHINTGGSLTCTFNSLAIGGNIAAIIGCAEFTGLNASPLGTPGANSGTSASESTGSVSSSNGVLFCAFSEVSGTNWTRSASDTTVFNDSNGSSDMTGLIQYKLVSSSPNTLTCAAESSAIKWNVVYVPYITS